MVTSNDIALVSLNVPETADSSSWRESSRVLVDPATTPETTEAIILLRVDESHQRRSVSCDPDIMSEHSHGGDKSNVHDDTEDVPQHDRPDHSDESRRHSGIDEGNRKHHHDPLDHSRDEGSTAAVTRGDEDFQIPKVEEMRGHSPPPHHDDMGADDRQLHGHDDDDDDDEYQDVSFPDEGPVEPHVLEQQQLISKSEPTTELEIALAAELKRRDLHNQRLTAEVQKLKAFISKRKQTYKRKRKDEGAPTRALSAYNIFVQDRFSRLAKENEAALKSADSDAQLKRVPPASLVASTGNQWKELSAEEKAKYEERARADRKRYEEQMAKYQPPDKQTNRKRNKTGYNMFFSAHVLRLKQSEAGVPSERGSVARLVGNAWKELSAADKQYYEREAEKQNGLNPVGAKDEDIDDEEELKRRHSSGHTPQEYATMPQAPPPHHMDGMGAGAHGHHQMGHHPGGHMMHAPPPHHHHHHPGPHMDQHRAASQHVSHYGQPMHPGVPPPMHHQYPGYGQQPDVSYGHHIPPSHHTQRGYGHHPSSSRGAQGGYGARTPPGYPPHPHGPQYHDPNNGAM